MTDPTPYHAFISYARDDNTDFDSIVDVLKQQLSGRFEAVTGSKLEIFVDRDDIGWGERWREKIADSIRGSTLFIPVVTMRFFNSAMCRDELSAFHAAAKAKGVADLILPLVLAGDIRDDHPDELVRTIGELNYQRISSEFEDGYQSPAWKQRIGTLVNELRDALARAADALAADNDSAADLDAGNRLQSDSDGESVSLDEIDESTILEKIQDLTEGFSAVTSPMEEISRAFTERSQGRDLEAMSSGQRAFFFGALAQDLRDPALDFAAAASLLEADARQADAEMRAYVDELQAVAGSAVDEPLAELRKSADEAFGTFRQQMEEVAEMQKTLRMLALRSVKLRQAVRPISSGLNAMQTAVNILASWSQVGL